MWEQGHTDQVRSLPGTGSENDLDTLAAGKTPHARVRNQLSVETEVSSVLLDLTTDEGTELARGELLDELLAKMLLGKVSRFGKLGTRRRLFQATPLCAGKMRFWDPYCFLLINLGHHLLMGG